MDEIRQYPNNTVLLLQRDKNTVKVVTTEKPETLKMIRETTSIGLIIETKYITEKEAKHLFVDECINGYELRLNLLFKKGLYGIAKELAEEREAELAKLAEKSVAGDEFKRKLSV